MRAIHLRNVPKDRNSSSMRSRIFLLENDAQLRDAMTRLLRRSGYLTEAYSDVMSFIHGTDFDALAGTCCIVADMALPDMTGPELLNVLAADRVSLPVVFTTDSPDVQIAVETMRYGASYVIQKPVANQDLLATIMLVIAEFYVPELGNRGECRPEKELDFEKRLASLSPRQREILACVYAGDLNRSIAEKLGISVKTVELHRARMMQKMQADSLIDLIKITAQCSQLLHEQTGT